jgi:hypothetical protein
MWYVMVFDVHLMYWRQTDNTKRLRYIKKNKIPSRYYISLSVSTSNQVFIRYGSNLLYFRFVKFMESVIYTDHLKVMDSMSVFVSQVLQISFVDRWSILLDWNNWREYCWFSNHNGTLIWWIVKMHVLGKC